MTPALDHLRGGTLPARSAVLAAHPDDEIVGAAILLSRSKGCSVIHLTDGAPHDRRLWPRDFASREEYAALRHSEARDALALAGVTGSSIHCLGAVDQESARGLVDLARSLAALLGRLQAPILVLQPYEGGHPDHDAAAMVGRSAALLCARARVRPPALVEMTSYHARGSALVVGEFLPDSAPEIELLPSAAEIELKRRMLAAHASQAETLAAFPPGRERFRAAPRADFSRAPHAGELYAERMGWMRGEEFRSLTGAALRELGLPPIFP